MWRPVLYAVAGLVVGGALGAVLTPQKGAVLAALTGALVAAAGSRGPTKVALRLASLATAAAVIVVFAAFAVTGHPWWAAAAMAAVAVLTSAVAAAGPIGAALGMLGSVGFVLAVVGAATVGLVPDVSVLSGALRAVLGAVGGLIVAAVGAMLRNRRASDGDGAGPEIPAPWGPMWASLRSFDEHTRDGVRRAIPLAIGMFIYQRTLDHDSLWVFLAAFAVLLPTGKTAVRVAAARVISTVVGVLVISVLGLVGAAGVHFRGGDPVRPRRHRLQADLPAAGRCVVRDGRRATRRGACGKPGRLGRAPPARHAAGLRDGRGVDVSALAKGQTGRRRRQSTKR